MKKFSWILVVFGKGKAMNVFSELLDELAIPYTQMDDTDLDEELITKAKTIIATPGVKPSHWLYQNHSKKIMSELSFLALLQKRGYFPRRDQIRFVGITGTNGKSTTTWALYQACSILEWKKKASDTKSEILIGWNFDRPLSGLLLDIIQQHWFEKNYIIVLEMSSFMLWKLQHMEFDVGVLLNISPDHIDRHGSMKDYLRSKLTLLRSSRYALTREDIKQQVMSDQMWGISLLHKLWPFTKQTNTPDKRHSYTSLESFSNPMFPWDHNKWNFWAVDAVLQELYGEDYDRLVLDRLQAVAHRLESISCRNNKIIIDDAVSSSPHALRAAFDAMEKPFVAVSWGYNNGDNYDLLFDESLKNLKSIVLYGEIRAHLYPLAKQHMTQVTMVETLEEALEEAWKQLHHQDISTILYSPWAKSFDQFDNVYHRIEMFKDLVKKYI